MMLPGWLRSNSFLRASVRGSRFLFSFVLSLALVSTSSRSQAASALSDLSLISRCYSALTARRLLPSHPLYRFVRSGQLSGEAACEKILQETLLHEDGSEHEGELLVPVDGDGSLLGLDERRAVLENFYLFHRTWFESNSFIKSTARSFAEGTHLLHDQSVGALYITRALFQKGVQYSSVVTLEQELEALRSLGSPSASTRVRNCYDAQERLTGRNCGPVTFSGTMKDHDGDQGQITPDAPVYDYMEKDGTPPIGVQLGEIRGVRRLLPGNPRYEASVQIYPLRRPIRDQLPGSIYTTPGVAGDRGVKQEDFNTAFRMLDHAGGGLLGSKSHLLLNFGRPDFKPSDGGLVMYRRWAQAVYSELLCRDLPVLRPGDVNPQEAPTDITPSFRSSRSCMQCHSSIDPMAATRRNEQFLLVTNKLGNQYRDANGVLQNVFGVMPTGCHGRLDTACFTYHMVRLPVSLPGEPGAVDQDPDFFRRPPAGRLKFRSFSGALVDEAVTGAAELGARIAATDDLYVCAASRYFKFLTGVDVPLDDLGAPGARKLSSKERSYRDGVIALGRGLKSHQNVRKLISEILRSEIFKSPHLGLEEEGSVAADGGDP